MKKLILSLIAAGVASLVVSANAQPGPPGEGGPGGPDQPGPPPEIGGNAPDAGSPATANADTNNAATAINPTTTVREPGVVTPSQRGPAPFEEIQSQFMPPTQAGTNVNDLTLNFTHAPLDMVLNYLSDAAGFIIIQDTRVTGTVTVNGKHLTQDEAVDLLNAVLNKNNYAAMARPAIQPVVQAA